MKCPCGCNLEIPNGCFWAKRSCRKKVSARGIHMPQNGEFRKDARERKRKYLSEKGKNDGR
jgi:hypothetical protein